MQFRPVLTKNANNIPINMGQLIIDSAHSLIYVDIDNEHRIQIISSEGGSTSYTKAEIDEMIETITNTFNDYYTKTNIDTKLNDYYTKTTIDTKLNDYYTKTAIDEKIGTIETQLSEV